MHTSLYAKVLSMLLTKWLSKIDIKFLLDYLETIAVI